MVRAARTRNFARQRAERPGPSGIDVSNRQGQKLFSGRSITVSFYGRSEVSHHPWGVSQQARAMVSVLSVLTSNTDATAMPSGKWLCLAMPQMPQMPVCATNISG